MNVERLHSVLLALEEDLDDAKVALLLSKLQDALTKLVAQRQLEQAQRDVAAAREALSEGASGGPVTFRHRAYGIATQCADGALLELPIDTREMTIVFTPLRQVENLTNTTIRTGS